MHSVPTQKNHSQLQWVKCLLETAHDATFVSSEADALKDIQKILLTQPKTTVPDGLGLEALC